MKLHPHKLRRPLHLLLAASLLLLGWFQLHHELTAHLEHHDGSCEICVFTGHLGDSAISTPVLPSISDHPIRYDLVSCYVAPTLSLLFRTVLSQRGPPAHSPA
jgi:hypothetical protein